MYASFLLKHNQGKLGLTVYKLVKKNVTKQPFTPYQSVHNGHLVYFYFFIYFLVVLSKKSWNNGCFGGWFVCKLAETSQLNCRDAPIWCDRFIFGLMLTLLWESGIGHDRSTFYSFFIMCFPLAYTLIALLQAVFSVTVIPVLLLPYIKMTAKMSFTQFLYPVLNLGSRYWIDTQHKSCV